MRAPRGRLALIVACTWLLAYYAITSYLPAAVMVYQQPQPAPTPAIVIIHGGQQQQP